MPTVPVSALQDAIRNLHGCESVHVATVRVTERFEGKVAWEGDVEVFDLRGHPSVSRAYAWAVPTAPKRVRFVVVLHLGKVNSPAAAVRASVMAGNQRPEA